MCVNWSVCEFFETLLTWLDSQMHFFQQGTLGSQSDASLVFSQTHDCSPTVFGLSVPLVVVVVVVVVVNDY